MLQRRKHIEKERERGERGGLKEGERVGEREREGGTHTGQALDHLHLCNYEIAIESDTFIHSPPAGIVPQPEEGQAGSWAGGGAGRQRERIGGQYTLYRDNFGEPKWRKLRFENS